MKTIAILNRKGGTAKTVTTFMIGHGLARKGFRVLLIDADSQANLTADCGANRGGRNLMDALTGSVEAADLIQHAGGVDIIPAGTSLATADTVLEQIGKEYKLREALEPLQDLYDYALIDNGPSLNTIAVNALTAADTVLIPVQADLSSIQGVYLLMEIVEQVRTYTNKGLQVGGIILTRFNGRANVSKGMKNNIERLAEQIGTKLYRTAIRECVAIRSAETARTDIFEYEPGSNGAKDYEAVLDEFLEG